MTAQRNYLSNLSYLSNLGEYLRQQVKRPWGFLLLLLISIIFFENANTVQAATGLNRVINFQGKIANKSDGTNIANNTYSFTFKLYDAASSGNLLWQETQSSVSVTNGIFQVSLGSVTPFNSGGYNVDFKQNNLYLDVTFNGETFATRIQLASVAQAVDAEQLDGVVATQSASGFTLTGGTSNAKNITFNNSLTFSGTDGTTMTFPSTSTTVAGLSIAQTFTNAQTISPTQAGAVGLTVNTTTNGTVADGIDLITAHTSGTATNGMLINQNAAGTTTNGLQIERTSGTLTDGLLFAGTIGTDITTTSGRNLTITPSGSGNLILGNASGNVGINTSTPLAKLELTGGTAAGAFTGSAVDLAAFDDSNNTNILRITASGGIEGLGGLDSPFGGIGVYENRLKYSQQFSNGVWGGYCSSPTTITDNTTDIQAPDGTYTANKSITHATLGCSGLADGYVQTATGISLTQPYTVSLWMRGLNGNEVVDFGVNDSNFGSAITLTKTWKRYSYTVNSLVSDATRGIQIRLKSASATYYLWGAQVENRVYPGVYAATTSVPFVPTYPFSGGLVVNGTGSALLNSVAVKGSDPIYDVKAWGAKGDGVTDDTAAIQAALDNANTNGGGEVYVPPGTYITTALTIYSNIHFIGSGIESTILQQKNSANGNVITGQNFATLTGTNSTAGIHSFSIENMTIDGNKANNTAGYGIQVYGYEYVLQNIRVRNAKNDGIYSEWSTSGAVPSPNSMEAHVSGLKVHDNGGSGITWAGPHDSVWTNIEVWNNSAKGIWLKNGSNGTQIINTHSWANSQTYAYYIESTGIILDGDVGEGASIAQVMIGSSDASIIGGFYYASGGTVGIQIGDGTHTNISLANINTKLNGFTSGAVQFNSDGGSNKVVAWVNQSSGSAYTGTPSSTDELDIQVSGGGTGSITALGTGLSFATPNAFSFAGTGGNNFVEFSATSSKANLVLDAQAASNQSALTLSDNGSYKWQIGRQTDDSFFMTDSVHGKDFLNVDTSGNLTLTPSTTTGSLTLDNSTDTNTINIGNANTATTKIQTINIGAGTGAGTGKSVVTVGSTANASALTLQSGTGNINLSVAAGGGVVYNASAVPTVDMLAISNAGQAVTAADKRALYINYVAGSTTNISSEAEEIDINPSSAGVGSTWSGLKITKTGSAAPSGAAAYGIKLEDNNADIMNGIDRGIDISGGGWDSAIAIHEGQFNTEYGGFGLAQNLVTFSEQFDNAAWTKSASTTISSANSTQSPNGETTADTIQFAGAGLDTISQTGTGTAANNTFAVSVWLKASSAQTVRLGIQGSGGTLNLQTQTVNVTTNWRRYSFIATLASGTTGSPTWYMDDNTNSSTFTVIAWGAQLEQLGATTDAAPGPYMMTNATAVNATRSIAITDNAGVFINTPTKDGNSTANANSPLTVNGGNGGTTTTNGNTGGNGGTVVYTLGAGGGSTGSGTSTDTSGNGGGLTFTLGAAGSASNATSTGNATGGTGGAFSITAGNGGAATSGSSATATGGAGGGLTFLAGNGGNASTGTTLNGGAGGSISITAGNAGTGGNPNGGSITINSGTKTGTGTSTINIGTSNTTALVFGNATTNPSAVFTSNSANALTVGLAGSTNPAFNVDASTGSSATGLNIKSAAAGAGLALSVISSGTNENLTLNAKGSGTISIAGTSTGAITLGQATTISTGNLAVTAGALTFNGTTRISNAGVGTFITATAIASQTFTTNNIADSGALTIKSATTNAITLDSGTTGTVNLGTSNNAKTINIGTGTSGDTIHIGDGAAANAITIGSTTASETLALKAASAVTLQGSATTCSIGNGTGTTSCTSDKRLKQNITTLTDDTLSKVLALRPVTFNWNDLSGHDETVTHIGLIAQEVQQQFSDAVHVVYTDPTLGDIYGVDYGYLVVPAIKAIQQQQVMLTALNAQVNSSQLLQVNSNGQIIVNNANGSTGITMDTQGNATFAGVVTAKEIKADRIDGLDALSAEIASLSATISSGSAQNPFATESAVLGVATSSGELSLDNLNVGIATVSSDLRVKGNGLFEGVLNVIDTLVANNVVINGTSDFFGNVIFHTTASFQGHIAVASDTAGKALIKQGTNSIAVTFATSYTSSPIVTATIAVDQQKNPDGSVVSQDSLAQTILNNGYTYVITNVNPHGFTILLNKNATEDLPFAWTAYETSSSSLTPTPTSTPAQQ